MALPLDVEIVQEAQRRASQEIIDTITALYALNTGSNGETFGTQTMSREDRILAFLDDARSGALDSLGAINEKFQQQYIHQYERDVAASPVLRAPDQERLSAGVAGGYA